MRAYQTIKFIEFPDVVDIRSEGRASHVGRIKRGRGYNRPRSKAASRRYLKRADRARVVRQEEQ